VARKTIATTHERRKSMMSSWRGDMNPIRKDCASLLKHGLRRIWTRYLRQGE
jgi:hypothetical protein